MKRPLVNLKLAFVGGVGLLAFGLGGQSASAQALFCPGAGGDFAGGTCITGGQGAVSTAAVSSQALSEASQNVTQSTADQAVNAVRRRMDQERPAQQAAAPAAAPARRGQRAVATRGDLKDPGFMVTKAPPVVSYGPTFAVWGHVFGDYEKWNTSTIGIRTLGNDPANISIERKTTTWGLLGGADWTVQSQTSVWVFGLLAGYTDSRVKFNNSSIGQAADNSTISTVTADFTGPSVGGYVTFATGPWSFDVTGKVDFLDMDQSFNEVLFVNANPQPNAGGVSTDVVNVTITGNANYRIPTSATTWWEPTVGFRYVNSSYGSSAFLLGIDDGELWRLQGGVRFGASYYWGSTQVVGTLTQLIYSDVAINGFVINSGAFGGAAVPNEEGEVRGLTALGLNFIHAPGTTTFLNGELRYGDDYWGIGGKLGLRVALN
jgi:outer membrane autotransporter protein